MEPPRLPWWPKSMVFIDFLTFRNFWATRGTTRATHGAPKASLVAQKHGFHLFLNNSYLLGHPRDHPGHPWNSQGYPGGPKAWFSFIS